MNVELYKILEASKINNYDQSDMGEPGTLYIPPIQVPKKGPGNLWGTKTSSTYGGGPHRQSQKARYVYTIDRPNGASQPTSTERQSLENTIFHNWLQIPDGNSNVAPLETNSTRQVERRTRMGSDENARLEFPPITPSSNNSTSS